MHVGKGEGKETSVSGTTACANLESTLSQGAERRPVRLERGRGWRVSHKKAGPSGAGWAT